MIDEFFKMMEKSFRFSTFLLICLLLNVEEEITNADYCMYENKP